MKKINIVSDKEKTNICEQCSKKYTPALKHPKQRFCSHKCEWKTYRMNHKEERTAYTIDYQRRNKDWCKSRDERYRNKHRKKLREFWKNNYYKICSKYKKTTRAIYRERKIKQLGGECVVCGFRMALHIHHIIPRCIGGTNDIGNLKLLCPNHHAMEHGGERSWLTNRRKLLTWKK